MRFTTDLPEDLLTQIDARLTDRDGRGRLGRNEEIASLLYERLDPNAAALTNNSVAIAVQDRTDPDAHGDAYYARSAVVTMMVDRYLGIIRHGRRQLRGRFSRDERLAVAAACNGWASRQEPGEMLVGGLLVGARPVTVLAAQVEDAIHLEGAGEHLPDGGKALIEKLNALSVEETLALLDAVETWWANPARPDAPEV